MNLLKSTRPIQYITLAYAGLYVLFIISGSFGGAYPSLNAEGIGVYSLFILFIVGFSLSWYNKIITGVIFLLWNIGMWILELFIITSKGDGFGILTGIPLLVLGVLFIVNGYKTKKDHSRSKSQQWKLALRLFLVIYTILYLIFISDDFFGSLIRNEHNFFFKWPGLILTGLTPIYLTGFILSWKRELVSGIIFIIWYAGLFYSCAADFGIGNSSGPLRVLGFPILVQGVLYIICHFKIKSKQLIN